MKIISGGQTGVDRSALDSARAWGLPCGGWCPKGRRAEDGILSVIYPLQETRQRDYSERTLRNIRNSHGTLIIKKGPLKGGTALTAKLAQQLHKPLFIIDLDDAHNDHALPKWLKENGIEIINIAGPRESQQPGIYNQTKAFLEQVKQAFIT